jgi:RNA recognition motif-containing protein
MSSNAMSVKNIAMVSNAMSVKNIAMVSSNAVSVKNLSFNSTIEDICSYFSSCGKINESRLVLSKAGKSRGQAFLNFVDNFGADNATKLVDPLLEGRTLSVELASASDCADPNSNSNTNPNPDGSNFIKKPSTHHPTTVFVSKFSKDVSNETLYNMFSHCGMILHARVVYDKRTEESKCHGLIQFLDESGKKAALGLNKQVVSNPNPNPILTLTLT